MFNEPVDASRYQYRGLLTAMDSLGRLSEKHGLMAQQRRAVGQVSSLTNDHQTAVITMEPDRNDMRREVNSRFGDGGPPMPRLLGLIPTTGDKGD